MDIEAIIRRIYGECPLESWTITYLPPRKERENVHFCLLFDVNWGECAVMIVYEIQNLCKIYPGQNHPANDNISLQIRQGEIFGLLGDNGAGKSTLVKHMANLLRPTSGTIRLWERPLTHTPMHVPLQVVYSPQNNGLLNNVIFGEALYFTALLRGLSREQAPQERDRLLALWQAESLRDRYSSRLSRGQRRLLPPS